jgi:hypothetical protein
MEAIGAVLFFLDLIIFHLATKEKGSTRWYWIGLVVINSLGLLLIIYGAKK